MIKEILATTGGGGGGGGGGAVVKTIYGSADAAVINNQPAITPAGPNAIYIADDGTQYQYFNGNWH